MKKTLMTLLCCGAISLSGAAMAFDGPPPPEEFGPPPAHRMMKKDPYKAKIDERLKLSVEQKAKLEANRAEDRKKLDPIMKKLRKKHNELRKLARVEDPNVFQKKKIENLRKDTKKLKAQADEIRKANMKAFEEILTPAQKTEFAKIKAEHKQKMEAERKKMEAECKKNGANPNCRRPQGPPPPGARPWGPPPPPPEDFD